MQLVLPVFITVVSITVGGWALSYVLDKCVSRHERGGDS